MYACRFMSRKELRTLQSGKIVTSQKNRCWDKENLGGSYGDYCFFALNNRKQVIQNIGLLIREANFHIEGRMLVIVKIRTPERSQTHHAGYHGCWPCYEGEYDYWGRDQSRELFIPKEYSSKDVTILAIRAPKSRKEACFEIFKEMKKKHVLSKGSKFAEVLKEANDFQEGFWGWFTST